MNLLLRPVEVTPATARRPFRKRQADRLPLDLDDEELLVWLIAAEH